MLSSNQSIETTHFIASDTFPKSKSTTLDQLADELMDFIENTNTPIGSARKPMNFLVRQYCVLQPYHYCEWHQSDLPKDFIPKRFRNIKSLQFIQRHNDFILNVTYINEKKKTIIYTVGFERYRDFDLIDALSQISALRYMALSDVGAEQMNFKNLDAVYLERDATSYYETAKNMMAGHLRYFLKEKITQGKDIKHFNLIDAGCGNKPNLINLCLTQLSDLAKPDSTYQAIGFDIQPENIAACQKICGEVKNTKYNRQAYYVDDFKNIENMLDVYFSERHLPHQYTVVLSSGSLSSKVLKDHFEAIQIWQAMWRGKVDCVLASAYTALLISRWMFSHIGFRIVSVDPSLEKRFSVDEGIFAIERISMTEQIQRIIENTRNFKLDLAMCPDPYLILKNIIQVAPTFIENIKIIDLSHADIRQIENVREILNRYHPDLKGIHIKYDSNVPQNLKKINDVFKVTKATIALQYTPFANSTFLMSEEDAHSMLEETQYRPEQQVLHDYIMAHYILSDKPICASTKEDLIRAFVDYSNPPSLIGFEYFMRSPKSLSIEDVLTGLIKAYQSIKPTDYPKISIKEEDSKRLIASLTREIEHARDLITAGAEMKESKEPAAPSSSFSHVVSMPLVKLEEKKETAIVPAPAYLVKQVERSCSSRNLTSFRQIVSTFNGVLSVLGFFNASVSIQTRTLDSVNSTDTSEYRRINKSGTSKGIRMTLTEDN